VTVSNRDLVKSIFQSCRELSRRTGRHISPDGHLVGSLGEVYAAEKLHLQLQTASNAGYDALDTHGRRVEIKTTTRASISLSTHGNTAERLIVIHLDPDTGTIMYDLEPAPAWELAGAPQKNGQKNHPHNPHRNEKMTHNINHKNTSHTVKTRSKKSFGKKVSKEKGG